jgi:hypothetical protein
VRQWLWRGALKRGEAFVYRPAAAGSQSASGAVGGRMRIWGRCGVWWYSRFWEEMGFEPLSREEGGSAGGCYTVRLLCLSASRSVTGRVLFLCFLRHSRSGLTVLLNYCLNWTINGMYRAVTGDDDGMNCGEGRMSLCSTAGYHHSVAVPSLRISFNAVVAWLCGGVPKKQLPLSFPRLTP